MNWSDEKYVKLYTRDTLTWRSWSWQGKALLGLLLRKVDGAGVIETGGRDEAEAVALQVEAPVDFVRPGLEALLASGTLSRVSNGLVLVKFLEAQEATKTPAQKKRDQRERDRAKRFAPQLHEIAMPDVTGGHRVSPAVPLQPSPPPPPAQPTTSPPPAQAKKSQSKKPKVGKAAQPDLPAIPPPPAPPPRAPSWQQALYEDGWVPTRWHYLGEAQLPQDDEALPDPALVNTAVSRMLADVPEERRKGVFLGMAEWFCQQPWGAIDGQTGRRRDSPWPWKMFCAEKVWSQARQAVDAADAAERGYDA